MNLALGLLVEIKASVIAVRNWAQADLKFFWGYVILLDFLPFFSNIFSKVVRVKTIGCVNKYFAQYSSQFSSNFNVLIFHDLKIFFEPVRKI